MIGQRSKFKFVSLIVIIVLVVIGVAVWIGVMIAGSHSADAAAPSGYSAVYLTSGDVYFGKLHWFPRPYLTDVLYLERGTAANGQPQLGVGQLSSAFWGPTNEIYLNSQQVLFTSPLSNGSQLIPVLENPALLNQAAQQQQQQQAAPQPAPTPAPAATGTSK